MGQQCCAGNIFKKLYDQYGQNFVKLMTIEKGKDVIRDQFGKVKGQAETTFNGFTTQTNTLVDGKIGEVTKIYEDVKNKVNIGGALQMVEKQQGKSIDQLSGFTKIKSQITDIRTQTVGKIEEKKNTIFTQMNKSQDDMVTNLEKDRPKIELYEELPDPLKKVVRDTAEKEFAKQLSNNKEKIVSTITGQFGPEAIKKVFSQINPESALKNVVSGASGNLTSELTKHLPGVGNLTSGLGGFGGGFF